MSSRTGNAFRGFVRDRAQDAQEVADASEAGRTPAPHERKVFSGRERLTADTSWIVTKKSYFLFMGRRGNSQHRMPVALDKGGGNVAYSSKTKNYALTV
ncbi:MAG: hypothetical protein AUK31_01975 [Fibrobacteres bacterium CG2_30_45_31]|nr:MAG: hypothetical protein AUK31_01975 [Fibrobacteres bacterium CG2_30_45_31]